VLIDTNRKSTTNFVASRAGKARKSSSRNLSHGEDEGQSPADEAAAAQLKLEELSSHQHELQVFDIPSSDEDDESASRNTLKRKRVPSKPSGKSNDKTGQSGAITAEPGIMVAQCKRSRNGSKPEKPAGPKSSKLTAAGKITKSAGFSASQKGKEQSATQTIGFKSRSVKPSTERDTLPRRSRVARSQSRQLSEEPSIFEDQSTISEEIRPKRSPNLRVVISENPRRHPASALQTQKQKPDKPPLNQPAERNLRTVPEESLAKKSIVSKGTAAVRSKIEENEATSLFAEELTPKAQPRKRLIDSLGAGPGRPPKRRSCSPVVNDVSGGESSQELFEFESQSQDVFESQEAPSQEVKITIQRQFGNGRGGSRVTYARQRSYKAEEASGNLEDFLNIPLPTVKPMQSRRRLEHPKLDEDDELREPKKPKNAIKNIHELRAAGEHHRFIDDVEDLFLDIEGNGALGTKRSG
jgi:hypothetical protein